MSAPIESNHAESSVDGLCLACGLCCNGAIFGDVKVQPDEPVERLRALGLRLTPARPVKRSPLAGTTPPSSSAFKLRQPCCAHAHGECRIYPERPRYCREFECALFKSVQNGKTSRKAAFDIIHTAAQQVDKVRGLLATLGEHNEMDGLAARYRRLARRMESAGASDADGAGTFSELTLAMHDLNLLLSERFYPGS